MLIKFKPTTPGLRGTVLVSKKNYQMKNRINYLPKNLNQQEVEITKEELLQEGWVEE